MAKTIKVLAPRAATMAVCVNTSTKLRIINIATNAKRLCSI
jgi:hypothetical protein